MTTSLSGGSSSDVFLHFPPFFAVELKRYQESEVLVLGPATHAVLVLYITLLVLIALTLEVRLASSVRGGVTAATSQIFSKSLVRNSAAPYFTRRQLGRVLLQCECIRLAEGLINVTLHDGALLVFLVDLGLRCTIAKNRK